MSDDPPPRPHARARLRFRDTSFSPTGRYALGVEETSGRHYLAIPVSNGIVDYEEYFALTPAEHERFTADDAAATAFADQCRRRERDGLLIQAPGRNRGTPV